MADRRKKGKEYYGAGKIQRRKQLQLARASKGEVLESTTLSTDVGESSESVPPSSDTMSMAGSSRVTVTPTAQV